jgi:hypothetical protein
MLSASSLSSVLSVIRDPAANAENHIIGFARRDPDNCYSFV